MLFYGYLCEWLKLLLKAETESFIYIRPTVLPKAWYKLGLSKSGNRIETLGEDSFSFVEKVGDIQL